MKNSIQKIYGVISIVGVVFTILYMSTLFVKIGRFDESLLKTIIMVVYIPVFLTTSIILIKGANTIKSGTKLCIGNLFKYNHNKKVKEKINKNTYIIGGVILSMIILGINLIWLVNIFIMLPIFISPIMNIIIPLLTANTIFVFLFGVYRIILE